MRCRTTPENGLSIKAPLTAETYAKRNIFCSWLMATFSLGGIGIHIPLCPKNTAIRFARIPAQYKK
jgi:hypothetical protein